MFFCFFLTGFLFSVVFFSLFLGIVVLFVCVLVFYLFIYFLLLLSLFIFFVVAASGREGCVLGSFCLFFFLLSFCRGEGYFILRVGGVRDSSSTGESLT